MACDEMQEWNDVEEQVEELISLQLPQVPPKEEIMEAIHVESHVLIDLQKVLSGKPNLKKSEMSPLLLKAAEKVLARIRERAERPIAHAVQIRVRSG